MNPATEILQKAVARHRQGYPQEALYLAQRAVLLAPADAMAFNIRGMILQGMQRESEARWDFDLAIALKPDFADALNNRGTAYARCGQFARALWYYERSLSLDPNQPHARYNRSTTLLTLGEWIRGFREFESRWALFPHEGRRRLNLGPIWNGEAVAGKTLLLHHEQGYGDALQFCRYALTASERGARVLLAVPPSLTRLFSASMTGVEIVSDGEPVPPHDFSCALMSLPRVFGTTPQSVPGVVPYLRADADRVRGWQRRLGRRSKPRVGLVWSGRRYPPINHPRDVGLSVILPLLQLDVQFVSLQQNLTAAEQATLSRMPNVLSVGDTLKDFADSAALLETLDLVITVDSAVAHLAGALGRPVWVLNRYATCWRWLLDRVDSPWYPSLRLFRQPVLGDWTSVIKAVLDAAARFLAGVSLATTDCPLIAQVGDSLDDVEESSKFDLTLALNAALVHHHGGRLQEASSEYRMILRRMPEQPEALHFLGVALAQLGEHRAAEKSLARAVAAAPSDCIIHVHYGNSLVGGGRHEEALRAFDKAVELNPQNAEAHYNRGVCLAGLSRDEEAEQSYRKAISSDPKYSSAYNNLGNLYSDKDRLEEALSNYESASRTDPKSTDAWINLSIVQRRLHSYGRSLKSANRALLLCPTSAEAYSSHGATLACMGRTAAALKSYSQALVLKPDLAEGLWNKALAHLSRGEFDEGWPLYEARWKVRSLKLRPHSTDKPLWGGELLEGRTILLHAEQGYGDTIQFCRYAPLVAQRGGRVILGVPGGLESLMHTLPGMAEVVSNGKLPEFDCHCPLLSLPGIFRTDVTNIPSAPYLLAKESARARWALRLKSDIGRRIGLVWAGSPTHTNDANRSIPLKQLMPLLRQPAQFVSLQKAVRSSDLPTLERASEIRSWGAELEDFADAAALVAELDLVITVDTAIAHLAGALGKPTWLLLPHVADWRWLQDRTDTPWYPTARLFRRKAGEDWSIVIEEVRVALNSI